MVAGLRRLDGGDLRTVTSCCSISSCCRLLLLSGSWLGFSLIPVQYAMYFFCVLFILFLFLFLHPIEVSLLSTEEFQNVNTVLALSDFFELAVAREHIESLDLVLGLRIQELELQHALVVLDHPDEALPPLWLHQLPVVSHLPRLELHQRLRALAAAQQTRVLLQLIQIHFTLKFLLYL